MSKRFYHKSDGGDFWTGRYWSRQPKTHYVVDGVTMDRVADCKTKREARKVAAYLNECYSEGETDAG